MSTILRTLKKLEEEKSVFDKNLDLKGMALHGAAEPAASFAPGNSRKTFFVLVLVLTGILLAGIYAKFSTGRQEPPVMAARNVDLPSVSPAAKPLEPKKKGLHSGVPLNVIPDRKDFDAEPVAVHKPAPPPEVPKRQETPAAKTPPPSLSGRDMEALAPLAEIDAIIRSAKLAANLGSGSLPPSFRGRSVHIPGLRVRGIVFFTEGNPANYILVSTPADSNVKLKVEDTVLDATVKKIEPNKVSFFYKGQIAETGIGE
ncbi:MAG: hypothetical protein ACE5GQ_10240 [Nitrospinales bacterium]